MFVRRIIIGSSSLVLAAAPLVAQQEAAAAAPKEAAKEPRHICRPSELPIYPPPASTVSKVSIEELSSLEEALLEPISFIRENVVGALQQCKDVSSQVGSTVSDTAGQFKFIVTYLREEDNEAQRVGAIAMGALSGFIFGLRGGIFKRITYSLLGGAGLGAVCYPAEASEYWKQGTSQGKLLVNVVYNFIYGVKPGDPQPEINFPEVKVPTTFSEFTDMAVGVGKSIKDALMPATPAVKPDEAKKD